MLPVGPSRVWCVGAARNSSKVGCSATEVKELITQHNLAKRTKAQTDLYQACSQFVLLFRPCRVWHPPGGCTVLRAGISEPSPPSLARCPPTSSLDSVLCTVAVMKTPNSMQTSLLSCQTLSTTSIVCWIMVTSTHSGLDDDPGWEGPGSKYLDFMLVCHLGPPPMDHGFPVITLPLTKIFDPPLRSPQPDKILAHHRMCAGNHQSWRLSQCNNSLNLILFHEM